MSAAIDCVLAMYWMSASMPLSAKMPLSLATYVQRKLALVVGIAIRSVTGAGRGVDVTVGSAALAGPVDVGAVPPQAVPRIATVTKSPAHPRTPRHFGRYPPRI